MPILGRLSGLYHPGLFPADEIITGPIFPGQSVAGSLFSDADAFFVGSLGFPGIGIVGTVLNDGDAFFAGTIIPPAHVISGTQTIDGDAFFAGTVSDPVAPISIDNLETSISGFTVVVSYDGPVDWTPDLADVIIRDDGTPALIDNIAHTNGDTFSLVTMDAALSAQPAAIDFSYDGTGDLRNSVGVNMGAVVQAVVTNLRPAAGVAVITIDTIAQQSAGDPVDAEYTIDIDDPTTRLAYRKSTSPKTPAANFNTAMAGPDYYDVPNVAALTVAGSNISVSGGPDGLLWDGQSGRPSAVLDILPTGGGDADVASSPAFALDSRNVIIGTALTDGDTFFAGSLSGGVVAWSFTVGDGQVSVDTAPTPPAQPAVPTIDNVGDGQVTIS